MSAARLNYRGPWPCEKHGIPSCLGCHELACIVCGQPWKPPKCRTCGGVERRDGERRTKPQPRHGRRSTDNGK